MQMQTQMLMILPLRERGTPSYPPPCGEGRRTQASLRSLRKLGCAAPGWGSCGDPPTDPHPQPLPSRLRACPLPANLKVTKPEQAGVWLGRGAHRVRGNNIF